MAPRIFCALDRADLDGALALGRALDGVVDGFKFGAVIGEAVAEVVTGERPAAAITAWAAGRL